MQGGRGEDTRERKMVIFLSGKTVSSQKKKNKQNILFKKPKVTVPHFNFRS